MSKKIEITEKKARQYNTMLTGLQTIRSYDSIEKIRRESKGDYGLEYVTALEMSYENVINDARHTAKGLTFIPMKKLGS